MELLDTFSELFAQYCCRRWPSLVVIVQALKSRMTIGKLASQLPEQGPEHGRLALLRLVVKCEVEKGDSNVGVASLPKGVLNGGGTKD